MYYLENRNTYIIPNSETRRLS